MKNGPTIQYVKECEKEYLDFLNLSSFPEYEIDFLEFTDEQLNSQQYTAFASTQYHYQSGKHTLKIWANIHTLNNIGKQTVFHELTHIYDNETLVNSGLYNPCSIHGYTEYHASQIQFLQALGVKSISQPIFFSMDSKISARNKKISVQDYLDTCFQHAIDLISNLRFCKNNNAIDNALGVLFNYYGRRSICIMYGQNYHDKNDYSFLCRKLQPLTIEYLNNIMKGWIEEPQLREINHFYSSMKKLF